VIGIDRCCPVLYFRVQRMRFKPRSEASDVTLLRRCCFCPGRRRRRSCLFLRVQPPLHAAPDSRKQEHISPCSGARHSIPEAAPHSLVARSRARPARSACIAKPAQHDRPMPRPALLASGSSQCLDVSEQSPSGLPAQSAQNSQASNLPIPRSQ